MRSRDRWSRRGVISVSAPSQPSISSNTIVMLHMDGANLGTTFTDSAPVPNTFTAHGGAITSTLYNKFGTAGGLLVPATNSYVDCPSSASFAFGTGNFTIQTWVNFVGLGLNTEAICAYGSEAAGNDWALMLLDTGELRFFAETLSTVCDLKTGNLSLATGNWYHICMERFGTTIFMYLNGVSQALSGTPLGGTSLPNGAGKPFTIGARANNHDLLFNGGMDEFRVDNIALYGGVNFTPQTSAFS